MIIKAEQQVKYLVVLADTRKMEVKMPQDKEKNVLDIVNREWQRRIRGKQMTTREATERGCECAGEVGSLQDNSLAGAAHHEDGREAQH